MADIPVYQTKLEVIGTIPNESESINDVSETVAIFRKELQWRDRETIAIIFTDMLHRLIGFKIMAIGSSQHCILESREVIRDAALMSASDFIMGHNHPTGRGIPTKDDLIHANRISEAGKIVGISMLDSIIIGQDGWSSVGQVLQEKGDQLAEIMALEGHEYIKIEPNSY